LNCSSFGVLIEHMHKSIPAGVSPRLAGVARSAVLVVTVGAATVAFSAEATAQPQQVKPLSGQVVVLGDSLAVSPSRADSFPVRLQDHLKAAGSSLTVVNAGIRGDKTAGGLRRLTPLLTANTLILIVELGANDGLRGVEVAQIERNLSRIIESAQRKRIPVLLCGMMVPPRFGWDYALAFPKMFERVAAKYNVPLVPFILEGVALNASLNGPDGIHPNAAGAKRIANTVWRHLETMIRGTAVSAAQNGG
jgi:acyl-CoA thioesterase-1